jgi:hypothetical protein
MLQIVNVSREVKYLNCDVCEVAIKYEGSESFEGVMFNRVHNSYSLVRQNNVDLASVHVCLECAESIAEELKRKYGE